MEAGNPRGKYHWLIVACCCCLSASSIGLSVNCMGVFSVPVSQALGVGIGDVSMYHTLLNTFGGLFGPVAVLILRKMDLRKLLAIATAISAACFVGLANMTAVWQMYVYGAISGICKAMMSMVVIGVIIGNWFDKSMGLAMGISMSASGIVAAALNPVIDALIVNTSWRTGYLFCALLKLLLSIPALCWIRLYPSEKNLPMYGRTEITPPVLKEKQKGKKESSVLKTTQFWLVAGMCVCCSTITAMGAHMAAMATSVGLISSVGATLASMTMIGNMSSKLILGRLSDKLGPRRACTLMLSIAGVALLGLSTAGISPVWLLMLAALLLGASFSICGVGASTIERHIFGRERFSTVYSYTTMMTNISSAVVTSLIGYAYDAIGSYAPPTLVCFGFCLSSMVCLQILFIRHEAKKA